MVEGVEGTRPCGIDTSCNRCPADAVGVVAAASHPAARATAIRAADPSGRDGAKELAGPEEAYAIPACKLEGSGPELGVSARADASVCGGGVALAEGAAPGAAVNRS